LHSWSKNLFPHAHAPDHDDGVAENQTPANGGVSLEGNEKKYPPVAEHQYQ
jgi:hypothetical protein